jgi:hypothetical protein
MLAGRSRLANRADLDEIAIYRQECADREFAGRGQL